MWGQKRGYFEPFILDPQNRDLVFEKSTLEIQFFGPKACFLGYLEPKLPSQGGNTSNLNNRLLTIPPPLTQNTFETCFLTQTRVRLFLKTTHFLVPNVN